MVLNMISLAIFHICKLISGMIHDLIMYYLFKLHDGLRSPSSIQRKNVVGSVDILLFLDIFSSSNNLPSEISLENALLCHQIDNIINQSFTRNLRELLGRTNLRSNFFNFLSFINCTKYFKKHSSCLVSFAQLSSVKK